MKYKNGLNFEFRFMKYGVRIVLANFSFNKGIVSVFFLLDVGFGDLLAYFSKKGLWFYIDILSINKKFNEYKSKGFEIPMLEKDLRNNL